MKHNKKAMQMEFLLGLIILGLVLVVLLIFYQKTAAVGTAQNIPDTCRKSIEINAIGNIGGMELYDEVQCPTEYITINSVEPEDIKEEAADALAQCWYKMGEGQYEVFETQFGTTQYCVVCSVLEFGGVPQEVSGVLDYLDKNPAPLLYSHEPMSYTDYLQGFQSDDALQLLYDKETEDSMNTKDDYAVLFLYGKKGYMNKIWSTGTGAGVGFATGAVLVFSGVGLPAGLLIAGSTVAGTAGGYALGAEKTADWDSGILLYPYTTDALNQLNCEVLPVKQDKAS